MTKKAAITQLVDSYHLTLVIRLLVNQQGQVQQGTVVDLNGKQVGQFQNVVGLTDIVARWLAAWSQGHGYADPDHLP